jgi:hypothetical protein
VVRGLPPVADIGGMRSKQDRRFELAGMHVVVVRAADAVSLSRFRPVLATDRRRSSPTFLCRADSVVIQDMRMGCRKTSE